MTEIITSLETLPQAARRLLEAVGDRRVIAFYGKMGAGKTTLIKAVCQELGVRDTVTSPTFAIVNEYRSETTARPIYHFDFYRIRRMEEAYDLGYEEYIYSGDLCLIEWPEMIEPLLPDATVTVNIEEAESGKRRVTVNL